MVQSIDDKNNLFVLNKPTIVLQYATYKGTYCMEVLST